jgi:hypothetical protein
MHALEHAPVTAGAYKPRPYEWVSKPGTTK